MLKWPDAAAVDRAVRAWAAAASTRQPDLLAVGYFGSYARGDWSVGSDVDLVAIVPASTEPFASRALDWDLTPLPVPADLLVYTLPEWHAILGRGDRFARMLGEQVVWVHGAAPEPATTRTSPEPDQGRK